MTQIDGENCPTYSFDIIETMEAAVIRSEAVHFIREKAIEGKTAYKIAKEQST